jgi:ubiquitin-protein ligase
MVSIQSRRLNAELQNLRKQPIEYTTAYPDEKNMLIWYCLIVGPEDTPYHGGHYIYKIVHGDNYPFVAPDYFFLTPNGRYTVNTKICLTNSSFHASEWNSSWNIMSLLTSFLSIFLDDNEHGISHIHESTTARLKYAKESIEFNKTFLAEIYDNFDLKTIKQTNVSTAPVVVAPVVVAPVVVAPVVVAPVVVAPVVVAPVVVDNVDIRVKETKPRKTKTIVDASQVVVKEKKPRKTKTIVDVITSCCQGKKPRKTKKVVVDTVVVDTVIDNTVVVDTVVGKKTKSKKKTIKTT